MTKTCINKYKNDIEYVSLSPAPFIYLSISGDTSEVLSVENIFNLIVWDIL